MERCGCWVDNTTPEICPQKGSYKMKLCYPVTTEDSHVTIMGLSGNFEENLALISTNGFDGVELMVRDPRLLSANRLKQQLACYGLVPAAIGVTPMVSEDHITLASPLENVREEALRRARAGVELAAELQVPFCIGSFRGSVNEDPGNTLEDARRAFFDICTHAKQCGTTVLFETQSKKNGNYLNSVREGVQWIKDLEQDNIKMILDVFHMNLNAPDLLEGLAQAEGMYGMLHLCDSDRRMMGFGHFDLVSFLNATLAEGFDGFVSTEIKQLPDPVTAVEMTARYYNYYKKTFMTSN